MNVPQPQLKYKPRERKNAVPRGSVVTKPLQTPAVAPVASEKSWVRQQADDIWSLVSGIPHLLWHSAKAYKDMDYGAVLSGLMSDPGVAGNAIKETVGTMLSSAVDHYRNSSGDFTAGSIASAPVRRPLLVGLDALTLLSLGSTAGIKFATTGARIKMAPFLRNAEVAASTGNMAERARQLQLAAQAAQGSYGWANRFKTLRAMPVNAAVAGLKTAAGAPVVRPILESMGWDPWGLRATGKFYDQMLAEMGGGKLDFNRLAESKVGKQYWEDLVDVEAGYKALNPAEYPPEVYEKLKAFSEIAKKYTERELDMGLRQGPDKPYTQAMLDAAKLNHLRERMRQRGVPEDQLADDFVRAHQERVYAEADAFGTGDISRQSHWHAAVEETADLNSILRGILEPPFSQTARKQGILDRFLGGAKYVADPDVRYARYIMAHRQLQGRARATRAVISDPELSRTMTRDELRGANGEWAEIPHVIPKNLDYEGEMLSKMVQEIADAELRHGKLTPEAIQEAVQRGENIAQDLAKKMADDILEGLVSDRVIAVKPGVKRFLDLELTPSGPFGRLYDKGMNFWRDLLLNFMPRYYVNNLLGNSLLMILGGVTPWGLRGREYADRLAPSMKDANFFLEGRTVMGPQAASAAMRSIRKGLGTAQFYTEQQPRMLAALHKLGALNKDMRLADDLSRMVGFEGLKTPDLDKLVGVELELRNLAQEIEGSLGQVGRIEGLPDLKVQRGVSGDVADAFREQHRASIRPRMEAQVRSAVEGVKGYKRSLEDMEPLVKRVEEAYRWTERFLGPYGKITPLSRKYIRRVVPFWTFGSTMARLMFWMPFVRPKTTWLWSTMSQMALDAWEDERLPEYLRGSVWIGTGKGGVLYFTRMTGFNPFEMMAERKLGGLSIPGLLDPTQGPLLTAAVKLVGGYDQFSHRPPPLEPDQMIDSQGRVWEIGPNGAAQRVSPQTPWLDALGELVPQTSILNDIMAFSGFQVPGRGPKLYQMPDGTMFDPRHWQWGLANGIARSFGSAVTAINIDRARASQRATTIKMIRHLGKQALVAADPDERAQFMKTAKHALDALRAR